MRAAPGYVFAVSMAVAATMVAGFALATLVPGSGRPTSDWPTGTPSS